MKRVTMFYRNGYETSFRTTEDGAVRLFTDFCRGEEILVEKYRKAPKSIVPLLVESKWVDAEEVSRIEVGRSIA